MPDSKNENEFQPSLPKLLVSVRSANEVPEAIKGGAEIIDVKETSRGSLGMADVEEIQRIRHVVDSSSQLSLSAALGELKEWQASGFDDTPVLPDLPFVKVGLAGMGENDDWQLTFSEFQNRFNNKQVMIPNWVSVIYADWTRCDAPEPEEVIDFAIQSGSTVVLYDTAIKDGKTLLNHLSVEELIVQAEKIHSAGLKVALAGSLKRETISKLVPIQPEIIAIRGAACEKGDRQQTINRNAITEFKTAMLQEFQSCPTS